jgi:hypothetical protein
MERESAKIKIRPNTSLGDASRSLEEKKMNLSCSDVIRYFQDVISMRFGSSELSTFNFDISTKGHLKISDLKSGEVFVGSCHFKGKQGQYNPSEIKTLLTVLANSIKHRELEERNEPKFRKVEAKRSKMHPGGLKDWVENEKWVDVRRPKKDGGYEPCGRNDTSKGSKPVCVPSNKAKSLDKKELENRKRQKAKKEKEPNPGKKPNTTKYTEEAGGKSNVSNNNNLRFVGSMIPLSDLRPVQPKFIKVAIDEEEGEIPTTPISHLFDEDDSRIDSLSEEFLSMARNAFVNKLESMMGLTGPGDDRNSRMSIITLYNRFQSANMDEMDETSERRFNNIRMHVLDKIAQFATDNGNMNLFMVAHKLFGERKNPFSYSDVKEAVKEVYDEVK